MKTAMDQYLIDSARTAAGVNNVNLDMFENFNKVLHQGMDIVVCGTTADALKRSLFYSDPKIQERLINATNKAAGIYTVLESKEFQVTLSNDEIDLLHALLGISSEVGELMEELIIAKTTNREIDIDNYKEEAGDIMWYLALLLRKLSTTFEEVSSKNIAKLKARYPQRFTTEDALERDLDKEKDALAS